MSRTGDHHVLEARAAHGHEVREEQGPATGRTLQSRRNDAVAPPSRARPALDDAHLLGSLVGRGLERAVPLEPGQGPDGAVGRVRPADPDRLRPRPRARARRGRQGRRARRAQGRHGDAHGRHPARRDEHVDDDQRDGRLAARPLHRHRRGARRRPVGAPGHDAERHHQGVPRPRDLRVPARPVDAPDRRHGRLHGRARPALEPGQHLLVPPAGGGRDAGPGDRVLARERDRRARRGPRARRRRGHRPGLRADLVLRQRRRALRRGAREAPRDGRDVGAARPRPLRRHRRAPPPLPLRRAGQLARPDRVAAGEQRPAHRARGARGDARAQRPRAVGPAAGLERGARPPPPVGPAVVAAHPAGARLRDRPARVPRPLRGLEGDGRPRGRARRRRRGRARDRRRARRRGPRGRLHEGRARRLAPRAHPPHRVGRAGPRRRQPLRGRRALAARRGRRRRDPHRRPGAGGRSSATRSSHGARAATRRRSTRRWPTSPRPPRATRTS